MEQEWISLNEFMRRNKMGHDAAKKMMSEGKIEYQKIGTQYKIKVSKNESINQEMKKMIEENARLKALAKTALATLEQIV